MDILLLVGRVLLAVVFAVAGLAKLADRAGSRQAMRDFGVPEVLASSFGVLLPLIELAVAATLLPTTTAWWGALGAFVLLLVFVAGITYNLARGRRPDCHCFGQLHSEPAGPATLVRNGLLAAVAGFVVWQGNADPGPSAVSWLGALGMAQWVAIIAGLLLLGLLGGMAWMLLQLMTQHGRLVLRIEALEQRLAEAGIAPTAAAVPAPPQPGLPVGTLAPAFSLTGLHGETLTLDFLRASGRPVMLIFSDPGCGPCNALLPEIGRWQHEHAGRLTIALITRGTAEANQAKRTEHGLTHVLLQQDRDMEQAYQVDGTPSAVIVRPDGTIGSPVAPGAEAIRTLLQTGGTPAPPPQPLPLSAPSPVPQQSNGAVAPPAAPAARVGDPAPPIRLPDLTGKPRDLAEFSGSKTLVLFWNPGCGYCAQMLDDLKAWEANPPTGAPKLLLVSTGTVEENRAMGLRSRVVLDQSTSVMRPFGVNGTPMAVLIDEQGKIASEVAAGASAVLELAGVQQVDNSNGTAKLAAPQIGDKAPPIKLPDLNGKMVELTRFRGHPTLVLFWNPGCGFCQRMLDDLKAWETRPPKGAPKLLVISTGTVEENRAMGLRSVVVLDQGFSAGSAFGATGTPSAVLMDAQGKIASSVEVGAPAVLTLANNPHQMKLLPA
jgi:peroxiredoxin/uncharacterized membrane protein YphA (DoxX/SURF4 family)